MIIKNLYQLTKIQSCILSSINLSYNFARATKTQPKNLLPQLSDLDPDKKDNQFKSNGRSWRAEQLRIKSTEDLHKLWFVCVKQKNLLLADSIVQKKITMKSQTKTTGKMKKLKKTMKRILTVVGQRQKIRKQYRQKLQQQYIQKKKQQMLQEMAKTPQKLPQITHQMLRAKYHQLRKGVDNTKYLQQIWESKQLRNKKYERMKERLAKPQNQQPFNSFFEKQQTIGEKPLQDQILRAHIKNWRMLNLKQRKIILGFLNARRARDAKSAFLKELKILGQKIAHQQASTRINNM